jgi:DMSO/TMAO reductase YedYZ molybdopterin-dependent catalytic subunit
MKELSRRRFIRGGLATVAGLSGLGVAAGLAHKYGLVPPDGGGLYGPGETLTYAAQRLLTRHSMAREFSRDKISARPFTDPVGKLPDEFTRLEASRFADWKLSIDGLVERPGSFSIDQLKSYPSKSQITEVACEEGWSYIGEWNGVPLSYVLDLVGTRPEARYIVYYSIQPDWWTSIDMADAMHPQTFLTYGMNGNDLPVPHGGPLRLRVPRQLGYKSVKFITRMTVTDDLKKFGKQGLANPADGYAWYAGI